MGMMPDVMWWMRPVDFWRLYKHHYKKISIEARKMAISLSFGKLDDAEDINDLYEDLFYMLSGNEKPVKNKKTITEEWGEERLNNFLKEVNSHIGNDVGEDYNPILV